MRTDVYRRRPDDNRGSIHQGDRQFSDVGHSQIKLVHRDPSFGQRADQVFHHFLGTAVHGYVGQDHNVFGLL